jgi:5'(3')-deoxyribonucleotidase
MNRVFIDMDGVLVDFDAYAKQLGLPGHEVKKLPGAYLAMAPMAGALTAVKLLQMAGLDVWIATKPPTGVPHAYAEKAQWVIKHLPALQSRLIMTPDKGLLGDRRDILVDDDPERSNGQAFDGTLIRFEAQKGWQDALRQVWSCMHRPNATVFEAHEAPVFGVEEGNALIYEAQFTEPTAQLLAHLCSAMPDATWHEHEQALIELGADLSEPVVGS